MKITEWEDIFTMCTLDKVHMRRLYKNFFIPATKTRQNIWTDMTLKDYQNDQYMYKRPLNSLVTREMQIKAIKCYY